RCEEPTCSKQASFAEEGNRHIRFCKDHKNLGMVNIRSNRCLAPGCQRGASFSQLGSRRGIFCGLHRTDGMISTRRR
ncbi:unnamed protein product, partial [Sphacelaria rigidula]